MFIDDEKVTFESSDSFIVLKNDSTHQEAKFQWRLMNAFDDKGCII